MPVREYVAVLAGLAFAVPALGQGWTGAAASESASGGTARGPGSVQIGPVVAYPGVDFRVGYNDNLYLRPNNVVGSSITVLSPYVRVEAKSGANLFDLQYRGEFARYERSPADNYQTHQWLGNARLIFDARNDMRLRFEDRLASDPRGSTDRAVSATPDEWRQTGLYALYGYGANGAAGRLEFDASQVWRRYTNNRSTTAAADRNVSDFGATFFWRVAPKTRLTFQGRYALIDYMTPGVAQSSAETRVFVGAQWEATAQTTGYAKIGQMTKRFHRGVLPDESSNAWDVGVRWSPLSYSVLDVSTLRTFAESTGIGDSILSSRLNVAWTHAWNSRLNHTLYWTRIDDDFQGAGATRKDETNAFGLRVNYQLQRWLRLGAEYAHTVRDSSDPNFFYRRNLILFSVGATL